MIICWGQRGNLISVAKQTMSLLVHDPTLSVNHDSSTGLGSPQLESSIFLMGKCHDLLRKSVVQACGAAKPTNLIDPTEPSQLPPLSKLPNCPPLELPSVRATWVGHPPGSILKSKSSWLTEETKCEVKAAIKVQEMYVQKFETTQDDLVDRNIGKKTIQDTNPDPSVSACFLAAAARPRAVRAAT